MHKTPEEILHEAMQGVRRYAAATQETSDALDALSGRLIVWLSMQPDVEGAYAWLVSQALAPLGIRWPDEALHGLLRDVQIVKEESW